VTKHASDLFISELNLLRNRLEAGESLYQCLSSMGSPFIAPDHIQNKFLKLAELMLEGRTLSAPSVKAFCEQIENEKKLLQLVEQKTLSPKIQAFVSAGISALLILSSYLLFPSQLKPSIAILLISLLMCGFSLYVMKLCLRRFEKELSFLEWIFFLRGIQLSLKCGLSFPTSVFENYQSLHKAQNLPQFFKSKIPKLEAITFVQKKSLWFLAARTWNTLLTSQEKGLPLSEMLDRSIIYQEERFKSSLLIKSEKLSYILLIPLFLFSLPSAMLILLAPLLKVLE
jgi:hypothetical protein